MVLKIVDATQAKVGTNIIVDGEACTVRKVDISKTGKHGHAKCRMEVIGMISGNKKVFVSPGHDRFEVPVVNKMKAQVLSKGNKVVNVMNLENFETLDLACPDQEVFDSLVEGENCEYWEIEGAKVVKRKL